MRFVTALVVLVVLTTSVYTAEIRSLPGYTASVNFKQYSGFFNVSATHRLHYWFVESQNNPSADPVLLWLNGGPGCSSLDGLMNELGPFRIQDDGRTLKANPYSWNLFANVLFLEAPAGVGFSYSTDGRVNTNDDQTSAENYEALQQFFKTFPQFRRNDFFIGGESYGGMYVPTLTRRVIQGQKKFNMNLKGIYIGNGYLDKSLNIDTQMQFAYSHGIVSEHDWDFLERTCCRGCTDRCDFNHAVGGRCEELVQGTVRFLWAGGLNPYDIYRDCAYPANSTKHRVMMSGLAPHYVKEHYHHALKHDLKLQRPPSGPPCMNDGPIEAYFNNQAVRDAIHIPKDAARWSVCSTAVENGYTMQYENVSSQILEAIRNDVRVLIYSGDTDAACNFLLGTRFAMELGIEFEETKKPFYHAKQIAGFHTKYQGLDFITIKGAGHMVPQWRPAAAFHMMFRYVQNKPY